MPDLCNICERKDCAELDHVMHYLRKHKTAKFNWVGVRNCSAFVKPRILRKTGTNRIRIA